MFVKKGWPQLAALAVILSPALFMSACDAGGKVEAPAPISETQTGDGSYKASYFQEVRITLSDGREVLCLVSSNKMWCTPAQN